MDDSLYHFLKQVSTLEKDFLRALRLMATMLRGTCLALYMATSVCS